MLAYLHAAITLGTNILPAYHDMSFALKRKNRRMTVEPVAFRLVKYVEGARERQPNESVVVPCLDPRYA